MATTSFKTNIGEDKNKISNASGLAKKTDYNAKISDIHAIYFTTFDYNKFSSQLRYYKVTKCISM